MQRRTRLSALALGSTAAVVIAPFAISATAASAPAVSVKTLHFDTQVGPNDATHCDVIGDLYTPSTASKAHPAPAILTTNGFGGSKNDQAGEAMAFAKRGYVVLSYSGLGFGGSDCNIQLDDPDWDGKAAKQLVDFLGGAKAATDGTKINYVQLDRRAHDGKSHSFDPRVGMVGGSYGGQVQFAAASVDPRIDTIVPLITWNDLSYSLAPNNTSFSTGVTYRTPGVEKYHWTTLFFAVGIKNGVDNKGTNKSYVNGCANFDARACTSKVQLDALGYPTPDTLAFARHASVASYMNRIKIPTLLGQGEADTLFNLQEVVATYRALRKQGTPVKMVWHSWGHSHGAAAPGEFDLSKPTENYEGSMISAWFDYYLAGKGAKPDLSFEYFRPWVSYKGSAKPAFASSPVYPAATPVSMFLSSTNALVSQRSAVIDGSAALASAPGGVPTSYSEVSALNESIPSQLSTPFDAPGTAAVWSSGPLAKDLDIAGVPTLTAAITGTPASVTQSLDPAGQLVVFAKLYDKAPDGTITLTQRLISPARISDASGKQVTIELPGIVHRFAKGHTLQLVIAASDAAYRGNVLGQVAQVSTSKLTPGVLQLPVVP